MVYVITVCLSVCLSVYHCQIAIPVRGHRLRIHDEKVTNLATFGALKFGFGDLLLFGLVFKTLVAILGVFNVYLLISNYLFWAT